MISCEVCDKDMTYIHISQKSMKRIFGRCKKCGLLQNIEKKLPSKIEGLDFGKYAQAQDLDFEKARRTSVLLRIRNLLRLNCLELSIFDIGTGAGYLLVDAQNLGFKVTGSELSNTAAALVQDTYGLQVVVGNYEELGYIECQNAVTMFCVLAHSVNPESLLRSINISLRSGGVLYFHTPRYCVIDTIAILLNRITHGRANHLFLRRIGGDHKRIYTRKSLKELLALSGFTQVAMTSEIGYGLKKENYFIAMGMPKYISVFLAKILNLFSILKLLPRNVYSVYAIKSK